MRCALSKSNFKEVFPIWKNYLWPERIEPIEETSALLFKEGIDMSYRSSEVFFIKAELDRQIIGVCSGQRTGPNEFRSRGLWVSENFRRKGIGSKLFFSVKAEAQKRACSSLWTLSRHSSEKFYRSVGMRNCGKTFEFEYGPHFWMYGKLESVIRKKEKV